jgi:hypothetical protein
MDDPESKRKAAKIMKPKARINIAIFMMRGGLLFKLTLYLITTKTIR